MAIADPLKLSSILSLLIASFELVGKAINFGGKVKRGFSSEGIYEVLDYEVTLRITDRKGKKAKVRKRQVVRYLQDGIVAFQDQAWGDGKILQNYRTSPGYEVDRYRRGHKTQIVISLRKVRNKGDVDEHIFEWEMHDGFLKTQGIWSTAISHRTKHMKVNIIFPKSRPPQRAAIIESNLNRRIEIDLSQMRKLPNGTWKLMWEKKAPRLHESYVLDWEW